MKLWTWFTAHARDEPDVTVVFADKELAETTRSFLTGHRGCAHCELEYDQPWLGWPHRPRRSRWRLSVWTRWRYRDPYCAE